MREPSATSYSYRRLTCGHKVDKWTSTDTRNKLIEPLFLSLVDVFGGSDNHWSIGHGGVIPVVTHTKNVFRRTTKKLYVQLTINDTANPIFDVK
jgi:hypothetical protein